MMALSYYHTYGGHSNEPIIRLSQRITKMIGMDMNHVYYGMSGSDANETNVKIVWYVNNVLGRPEKKKIIARRRSYHGSGLMTGSLTGQPQFHQIFDLPFQQVRHTSPAHYWLDGAPGETQRAYSARLAAELDSLIRTEGPETVAAFIAEPVVGSGGILPPPEGYWEEIQKVLARHDVLLIADEVVTGFGRTGAAFGSHLYGIKPDLMTIAKGLSSGYLPLSGVVVGKRIWGILVEGTRRNGAFSHGWTYSAHPVCAAAANANIDIIEREGLVENARDTGAYLQASLKQALGDHPNVGEVRGVGLMAAVEVVQSRDPRCFFDAKSRIGERLLTSIRAAGLLVRVMPPAIIALAPPLTVKRGDIDRIVSIIAASVKEIFREIE
jgi:L-2,4-diaminobutyrate transaminase